MTLHPARGEFPRFMEQLPHDWERPVTEEDLPECVSPEIIKRLQSLLRELYHQRSSWRAFVPPLRPPTHKETRTMLSDLQDVHALEGAKVLYLDDTPQWHLEFVTGLTLATRRRVERVFYHGESIRELIQMFRERLHRCPRPHLLIVDGSLELLPNMKPAERSIRGYRVLDGMKSFLKKAGVPSIGYSKNKDFEEYFSIAGADGFVWKPEPAQNAVRKVATIFAESQERICARREEEEKFLQTD